MDTMEADVPPPGEETSTNQESEKEKEIEKAAPTKKKIFHRTASIFLRNLPPTITRSEVEAVCTLFGSLGFVKITVGFRRSASVSRDS